MHAQRTNLLDGGSSLYGLLSDESLLRGVRRHSRGLRELDLLRVEE